MISLCFSIENQSKELTKVFKFPSANVSEFKRQSSGILAVQSTEWLSTQKKKKGKFTEVKATYHMKHCTCAHTPHCVCFIAPPRIGQSAQAAFDFCGARGLIFCEAAHTCE
jgi:hypothetical protein